MNVTLFAAVTPKANPYIALLQRSIEPHCAGPVPLLPRFTLGWALAHARPGQIAHLHWVESHINPPKWFGPEARGWRWLMHKLSNNRFFHPWRALWALTLFVLACVLTQRAGGRLVYTVHNLSAHYHHHPFYAWLERLANRFIFSSADVIHVHSQAIAEEVARRYTHTRQVHVVPLGNYAGWYPAAPPPNVARQHLGLPVGACVYLFLGQIAPYKGLENLLEAFRQLDTSEAWLVIAGKVAHAEYGAQILRLAQQPHVLYRPEFVPETAVPIYLSAATVVTLPFRAITTSSSIMLAYTFGRPVVVPDVPALAELTPSTVGVRYNPDEAAALGEALRQAQNTCWSEVQILDHARRFDWGPIGAQMAAVYRATLPQRAHAVPASGAIE